MRQQCVQCSSGVCVVSQAALKGAERHSALSGMAGSLLGDCMLSRVQSWRFVWETCRPRPRDAVLARFLLRLAVCSAMQQAMLACSNLAIHACPPPQGAQG